MHWKPTPLDAITTREVFYFDDTQPEACRRICNTLDIDCFPLLGEKAYKRLEIERWVTTPIHYDLDRDGVTDIFDDRLLDHFSIDGHHLAFRCKENLITGVIHFSDFEREAVYSGLYWNLNQLERGLRSYLLAHGLTNGQLIEHLETYRLPIAGKEEKRSINRCLHILKKEKDQLKAFEILSLRQLIQFGFSDDHDHHIREPLEFLKGNVGNPSRKTRMDSLIDLRNRIMHHRNLTGRAEEKDHDFKAFLDFVQCVKNIKFVFAQISKLLLPFVTKNLVSVNRHKLAMTNEMDDSTLKILFYAPYS